MSSDPTVFIVDDDPALGQALCVRIGSMRLRVETYASAQEFLDRYDYSQPGCVLLDVRLPGSSGLELLERLAPGEDRLPVIVISADADVPTVVQAMKAGAINFLEKPCRDEQLWEAIQEAIQWDAEHHRRSAQQARLRRRVASLSPGEQQVLRHLVEGLSNKAIAGRLGLSVRTIEVRRAKVMRKMKAESLAELVRMALLADADRRPVSTPRA